MKQLIPNGRYWLHTTGHEYVAIPTGNPTSPYVLTPPPDTTYANKQASLVIMADGTLHTNAGALPMTIDDLNYGGRVYDWNTGRTTQYKPPPIIPTEQAEDKSSTAES